MTTSLLAICALACSDPICGASWDEDRDGVSSYDDCDDEDAGSSPYETEYCDGEDNDCDGLVDNDAIDADMFWEDADGDGFGDPLATTYSCDREVSGAVDNGDDCDDGDDDTWPGADERCDGVDNDCDEQIDEGAIDESAWYADVDGDGHGDPAYVTTSCDEPEGSVALDDDCDDSTDEAAPGLPEVCGDTLDNDCDASSGDDCSYALLELRDAARAVIWGEAEQQRAGRALAAAGDVDDDGYDDLLVGAPGADGQDSAWLVPGPPEEGLLSELGHRMPGTAADVGAGQAVVGLGDLDADGYGELAFGSPGDDSVGADAGALAVVSGPLTADCTTPCGLLWTGEDRADLAGTAMAGGDADGDGFGDLWVSAPAARDNGAAYLLLGPIESAGALADADAVAEGGESGRRAGEALATGDADGDGADDLALLDPRREDGVVFLLNAWSESAIDLSAQTPAALGTPDETPGSVALSDLNADGWIDLAVGVERQTEEAGEAAAYVFFGPVAGPLELDAANVRVNGAFVFANAGAAVSAGGDVDGDGASELLIAAPEAHVRAAPDFTTMTEYPGSAWSWTGPLVEGEALLSAAASRFATEDPHALSEFTLSFAGDLDGDGRDELALGAWRDAEHGTNAGAVWVVAGGEL